MSTPTMAELLATIEALDDFLKSELGSRNILLQTNIDPSAGVGLAAPVGVFLFNPDTQVRYEKIGAANTDWRIVGAGSGGGIVFDATVRTANFEITEMNKGYFVNTTDNTVTATIQNGLSLTAGESRVAFIDFAGTYASNAFSFNAAPHKVQRVAEPYTSNVNNESVTFIYSGATNGFMVESIVP